MRESVPELAIFAQAS